MASNFYPDHVSVQWQVDGADVTHGVATDTAQRPAGDRLYKITSRLRVSAKEWNTPGCEFKCIVSFFNGTTTEYFSGTVTGEGRFT